MKSLILIILASLTINNQSNELRRSLTTSISTDKVQFTKKEPIDLTFVITNTSNEDVKVCKYLTPCEGFTGKFLEIKELKKNTDLSYKGVLVKRGAPEASDYIEIKANKKSKFTINIIEGYSFDEAGEYTIQFKGKSINNLPDSNIIKIKIRDEK